MEAVAERAGVGKPTVYRWFGNRHEVTMAALMQTPAPGKPRQRAAAQRPARRAARGAGVARALEQQLLAVAATLASRTGRNVTAMIAAADPDTEVAKAFRHHFVLARRLEGRSLLQLAIERGDLRADIDIDVALDQVYGALFFRVLLGHAPVDPPFVRELLSLALGGWRE